MPRVTLAAVNAAIRAAGGAEELVRGTGYYYFSGGTAGMWRESGVYGSPRLDQMSVAQWVAEWRQRHDDYQRSGVDADCSKPFHHHQGGRR